MLNKNGFDIYYDSLTEADWFSSLNPAFAPDANRFNIIGRRGTNIPLIEDITKYDKPDIILVKNGVPLLVLEKTQEVPTGHNVGQRFARLVRSIEMGIPTIYFFPFDAKKHGKHSNICNLNIRLLLAARNMLSIHNTPLLCVDWPSDNEGEIIFDGSENLKLKNILSSYVKSGFDKKCKGIKEHLQYMEDEYSRRLNNYSAYAKLPPSVQQEHTTTLIKRFSLSKLPDSFIKRPVSYVYKIGMTPENCKRQDPYTGMTFLYDYSICRMGPSVSDKKSNLVLYFPNLTVATWKANNPNDMTTKSCNWYLTANLFIFKDGYIFVRG